MLCSHVWIPIDGYIEVWNAKNSLYGDGYEENCKGLRRDDWNS